MGFLAAFPTGFEVALRTVEGGDGFFGKGYVVAFGAFGCVFESFDDGLILQFVIFLHDLCISLAMTK
jgi:hypothetical protein